MSTAAAISRCRSIGWTTVSSRKTAANWLGVSAYSRYAFNDRHAFAVRAERFRDPDGMASGFAQTLTEGTLTYELRPTRHFIFKLEVRRDHSSAPMFNGSRNQTLAIASGVAVF